MHIDMARIAISLPDELAERIHDRLDYGDNRSEWIREAIELKFAAEKHGLTVDDIREIGEGNPTPTTQTAD